jgi:hypothetical protein
MTDDVNTETRPEWLPEKFKTPVEMATAYSELEKKFSAPPENYDLTKSKFLDGEHEAVKELAQFAKSNRVPAAVMDKFQESVDKYFSEFQRDPAKELEKLGADGKARMDKLDGFVKAHLDEPQYKALMSNLNTAESVIALENLRNKFMSDTTTVPNGNAGSSDAGSTMEELQAELNQNLDKYQADPKYRKDLQGRMEQVKNKQFVDKRW